MATHVFQNLYVPGLTTSTNVLLGGDPILPLYAAPKQYVDNLINGITWKPSVRFTTITDISGTYATTPNNGQFTGVNLTSTGIFDLGAGPITVALNDRLLLKNQTDQKQNGIFIVTNITTPTAATITRAEDQNGIGIVGEVHAGNVVFVETGTTNANRGFILTGDGNITLNTNNLVWTQFSASGLSHSVLSNLSADDHVQYFLLTGRAGGQTLIGGTLTTQNLTLRANAANTTTGSINIITTTASTNPTTGALIVSGGVGVSGAINTTGVIVTTNTTASTTTTTGSVLTAGGMGVVGDVNIGGYVKSGNIKVLTNSIISENTNGNISILPNGTGEVLLKADPISNLGAATKQFVETTINNKKYRNIYPLTQHQVLATAGTYSPVAYFTWKQTEFNGFSNGKFIFEFVKPSTWNIDYQITDSASTVIWSGNVTSAGFFSVAPTGVLPTADTRLTLEIRRVGGSGADSSIYGSALQFDGIPI